MSGSISTALLHGALCCLLFLETRKMFAMVTCKTAFRLCRRPLGQFAALSADGGLWKQWASLCLTSHLVCPSVTCPPWLQGVEGCSLAFGGGEKWEYCWTLLGALLGSCCCLRCFLCLGLLLTSVVASPPLLLQGFSHKNCQGPSTFVFFGGCLGKACGVC